MRSLSPLLAPSAASLKLPAVTPAGQVSEAVAQCGKEAEGGRDADVDITAI